MNISWCMVDRTLKIHCKLPFTNTHTHACTHTHTHTHAHTPTRAHTTILSSLHPTSTEQYRHHNQFSKIWKCMEGFWVSLLQSVWKCERCRKQDCGGRGLIDGFAQPRTMSLQTAVASETADYRFIPICQPPHSSHLVRCLFFDSFYRYLILTFCLPHATLHEFSIQPT
jgi:hypothetical protein